jgi:hypothetical protein
MVNWTAPRGCGRIGGNMVLPSGEQLMALPNVEQSLESDDVKGAVPGYFVPEKDFRELLVKRAALRKELAALKGDLEQVRRDRDNYAKMFEAWEKEGVAPFTRREVEELEREGVSFATVVAQIEAMMRPASGGSGDDAQP